MRMMHPKERARMILHHLTTEGFVSLDQLSDKLAISSSTVRRDLERLREAGKLSRVRGGARLAEKKQECEPLLRGIPFHENIDRHRREKEAIGKAAAALCRAGDAVIIDGGSTTLQMCPYIEPLGLQVLTNSLHIVSALLQQPNTGVSIFGGVVFREQNIVLNPFEDDMPRSFRASRLFMGCAAITHFGLVQGDIILAQAERKLLAMADELVVLADSSKFANLGGHAVCSLSKVSTLITDSNISDASEKMIRGAGISLIKVGVCRQVLGD